MHERPQLLEKQPFGEELGGELVLDSHAWLRDMTASSLGAGSSGAKPGCNKP